MEMVNLEPWCRNLFRECESVVVGPKAFFPRLVVFFADLSQEAPLNASSPAQDTPSPYKLRKLKELRRERTQSSGSCSSSSASPMFMCPGCSGISPSSEWKANRKEAWKYEKAGSNGGIQSPSDLSRVRHCRFPLKERIGVARDCGQPSRRLVLYASHVIKGPTSAPHTGGWFFCLHSRIEASPLRGSSLPPTDVPSPSALTP